MLSIDEAIAREREIAEMHRNDIVPKENYRNMPWIDKNNEASMRNAEEHEQLAEWLEELKAYKENQHRSLRHMYEKGYNKALDDFVKFANTMPTVETDDGEIRPMWLEEMAEQLKEGGNIELSEHSKSQGNRTGK